MITTINAETAETAEILRLGEFGEFCVDRCSVNFEMCYMPARLLQSSMNAFFTSPGLLIVL